MCGEGNPLAQWVLPAAIAVLVVPIANRRVLGVLSVGLIVVSFGMSEHYTSLVHDPNYTGNRKWRETLNRVARKAAAECIEAEHAGLAASLDAGWVDEVFPECSGGSRARVVLVEWHTFLTGLYRSPAGRLWFDGGSAVAAFDRIAVRRQWHP